MSNIIIKKDDSGSSFLTIEGGHTELSQEIIRGAIGNLEKAMIALPDDQKIALETKHSFADGIYTRTVFMKAGSLITGKIHKLEHIVVIGQGSASVVSEEFGSKMIKAPMVFVSRPYVQRALFVHEDMVWTTVHKNPSNTQDLDILEEELIAKDFKNKEGE